MVGFRGIISTRVIKQIEEAKGSTDLFGAVDPGALARKGIAEEVAKSIAFLLNPESSFVNGVVVLIDGGWISRSWRSIRYVVRILRY